MNNNSKQNHKWYDKSKYPAATLITALWGKTRSLCPAFIINPLNPNIPLEVFDSCNNPYNRPILILLKATALLDVNSFNFLKNPFISIIIGLIQMK